MFTDEVIMDQKPLAFLFLCVCAISLALYF